MNNPGTWDWSVCVMRSVLKVKNSALALPIQYSIKIPKVDTRQRQVACLQYEVQDGSRIHPALCLMVSRGRKAKGLETLHCPPSCTNVNISWSSNSKILSIILGCFIKPRIKVHLRFRLVNTGIMHSNSPQ
jgi:hypothetical protein